MQSILNALAPKALETSALLLVLVHLAIASAILAVSMRGVFSIIGLGALWVRTAAALADRLTAFELPFDGGDAEGFFRTAVLVSSDLTQAGQVYGGAFTALWGYIFAVTGPERLIGQYTNVLLSLTSLLIVGGILKASAVRRGTSVSALTLMAFLPTIVVFSSGFLREAIIQFLLAASLAYFMSGLRRRRWTHTFAAFVLVAGASIFHAGVLGVLLGYGVVSAFVVSDGNQRFRYGFRGVFPTMVLGAVVVALVLVNPDVFLGKFEAVDSAEDVLEATNSRRGGAAYLTNLQITSFGTLLLYAPIRALYFFGAPMPWDWRRSQDATTFVLDAVIYLGSIILAFVTIARAAPHRVLVGALLITISAAGLLFGAGVSNAGTALRHRYKLLALVLVMGALAWDALTDHRNRASGRRRPGSRADKVGFESVHDPTEPKAPRS